MVRTVFVFHVVVVGWIFFRAATLTDAVYILTHLFRPSNPSWDLWKLGNGLAFNNGMIFSQFDILLAAGVLLTFLAVELLEELRNKPIWLLQFPLPVRWAGYLVFGLAVLNLGTVRKVPFIYFQF